MKLTIIFLLFPFICFSQQIKSLPTSPFANGNTYFVGQQLTSGVFGNALKVPASQLLSYIQVAIPTIDTTSLSSRINARVKYTDTASMLSTYLRKVDTISLSSRIDSRVKYTDTSSMLSPYYRTSTATSALSLKVNYTDTSSMLSHYLRSADIFPISPIGWNSSTKQISIQYASLTLDGALHNTDWGKFDTAYLNYIPTSISSATNGQLLKYNGSNWVNFTPSYGTVLSITAGAGLTGGTITSSGTISSDQTYTNVWTGLQTVSLSNSSNTSFNGYILSNPTAATSGNQRYSPGLTLSANGWATSGAGSSQVTSYRFDVQPTQGVTNPTGQLTLSYSVNGGSYNPVITINNTTIGDALMASGSGSSNNFGAQMGVHNTIANKGMHMFVDNSGNYFWNEDNGNTLLSFSPTSGSNRIINIYNGTQAINFSGSGVANFNGTISGATLLLLDGGTGKTLKYTNNTTAPSTSIGVGIVNYYGTSATNFLGDPTKWILFNINGTDYKIPAY